MEKLRHPSIVNFIGAVHEPGCLALVTEFCPYGSVPAVLDRHPVSYALKLRILLDCSRGMDFLHRSGIMHRDLKPDNLLVASLEPLSSGVCRIADFGTTRDINRMAQDLQATKGVGTPMYMAPELLSGEPYAQPADVYSFALVMYYVAAEAPPMFDDPALVCNAWQYAAAVRAGRRPTLSSAWAADYVALMTRCWVEDAASRPCLRSAAALRMEKERARVRTRMSLFRGVVFADACCWLHSALRSAGDQAALYCEAPAIDVFDPPIEALARDRRVWPGLYRQYLAESRRAERVEQFPELWHLVRWAAMAHITRITRTRGLSRSRWSSASAPEEAAPPWSPLTDADDEVSEYPGTPEEEQKSIEPQIQDSKSADPQKQTIRGAAESAGDTPEAMTEHPTRPAERSEPPTGTADFQQRSSEPMDVADDANPAELSAEALAQGHSAALQRARESAAATAQWEARVAEYSAALEREVAVIVEAKTELLGAAARLADAARTRADALVVAARVEQELREAERAQTERCVFCGQRRPRATMRRLTLLCAHLSCADCLPSALASALYCARAADVPVMCPACAERPGAPPGFTADADRNFAAAVPPGARGMVDPRATQARARDLLKAEERPPGLSVGVGAFRGWLVQLLCARIYEGPEAPAIDVHDPPIVSMVRNPRLTPEMYKVFLARCRRTASVPEFPDIEAVIASLRAPRAAPTRKRSRDPSPRDSSAVADEIPAPPQPQVTESQGKASSEGEAAALGSDEASRAGERVVIGGKLSDTVDTQAYNRAVERARACEDTIGECEASLSWCCAVIDAAVAGAAEAKSKLLAATEHLSGTIRGRDDANAEKHMPSALNREEQEEQQPECVACGLPRELGTMRRLTLCCGHL
eukprot:m51a1_g7845 putative protein serine threonine (881) ;mRNA; r:211297-217477